MKILNFYKKKSYSILGIDVNLKSINIVELAFLNNEPKVSNVISIANTISCNPEQLYHHTGELSDLIQTMIASIKIRTKQVVLAIPDHLASLKIIQVNADFKEQDILELITIHLTQSEFYSEQPVIFDFNIIGSAIDCPKKLDILVVVTLAKHVEQRLELMNRCGLEIISIELESYATQRGSNCLYINKSELSKHSNDQLIMAYGLALKGFQ